ncbi:MAG: agmatinase [Spirochaetaceae bacterium]|nr:MAG: agmatinase [Spirochaetaceae bacterium]
MSKSFLEGEYPCSSPDQALFYVIPVPYEGTVSYGGGTARGPERILAASTQLEKFDGIDCPGEAGIHTARPVDCSGTPEEVLPRVGDAVLSALGAHDHDPLPVVLGGEHSITAPAVRAVRDKLRERTGLATPLGVIQIDAHADLRDRYEGSPLSHAAVMRRVHQDLGVPLIQIGVRALSREEETYRLAARDETDPVLLWHDARDIVPSALSRIEIPRDFPSRVYLTLDVDGLDPSICPATGTPVPGGLEWYQTLNLLQHIANAREIAAFDVVELAPIPGLHAPDYALAELTYRIMGMIARSRSAPGSGGRERPFRGTVGP